MTPGRLSLFLVLVLAVLAASLGLKGRVFGGQHLDDSHRRERAAATVFLALQGYRVEPVDVVEDRFVRATSGDCAMLVGVLSPRGWHNKGLEALAAPGVELFYVFDGDVYPRFPRGRALAGYLESRVLSAFTADRSAPSVLGVAADAGCRAQKLPWRRAPAPH
ncbi:hypothetical protein [Phenylobacterium sp.]|jgi:hypothetical protein|uniref:hypothetical protein n=1 Tax=Phenylobacterium sp. TaxID=1871053 RepID=UPI002E368A73|nr:hypothetical protein [Phenylobacterium sp.]HEX4709489.1 hypothetical protein [Phenylobacterium sp.]